MQHNLGCSLVAEVEMNCPAELAVYFFMGFHKSEDVCQSNCHFADYRQL